MKHVYERNGSRVLLIAKSGPIVIAVATDPGWAAILVDAMNSSQKAEAS